MRFPTVPFPFFRERKYLRITSDTDNYNIYTQAGSPSRAVEVILVIESGVVVGSTSTGTAALRSGSGWANGSHLIIINKGNIIGKGGAGGRGADTWDCDSSENGDNGSPGGDALDLQIDTVIDNTSGNIYGGGGGGGGGAGGVGVGFGCAGGGGGGGAGDNGGSGGSGGSDNNCGGNNGDNGSSGGSSGGAGGNFACVASGNEGKGGDGGGYGEDGVDGYATTEWNPNFSGGSGGAAGKAVEKNGNTVYWRGGNNASQVKGAVS